MGLDKKTSKNFNVREEFDNILNEATTSILTNGNPYSYRFICLRDLFIQKIKELQRVDHKKTVVFIFCVLLSFFASIVQADTFPFDFTIGRHMTFVEPTTPNGGLTIIYGTGHNIGTWGTGAGSLDTINTHANRRTCATGSGSECGNFFDGNTNSGVLRYQYDFVWKGWISASNSTDANRIKFHAGFGDFSGAGTKAEDTACSTAGGTDNLSGYWICYDFANQSTWLACSGDGSDWDCDSTGVAGPDATISEIFTLRVDARDMANVHYYINDINGTVDYTRTTLLPSSSNTTVVAGGWHVITTNTVTAVATGISYMKWTWF